MTDYTPSLSMAEMAFPQRLARRRKEKGTTEQARAECSGTNVSQLRRYETGKTQSTMKIIRKLVLGLGVSAEAHVLDADKHGPVNEPRLQFEAALCLSAEERGILMVLIEGILLQQQHAEATRRLANVG